MNVCFTINAKMNSVFVSILGLEPYIPYNISVYPKYASGFGHPKSTVAYTKEKGYVLPENCDSSQKNDERQISS